MEIKRICENIENFIPENRIDGVFIGDRKKIFDLLCKKIDIGWYICITGDIDRNIISMGKDSIYYYAKVTEEIKKRFLYFLENSMIETLYVFNESFEPMILIDDFPEDITINIEIF